MADLSLPAEMKVVWAPQPGPQTALLECPIYEIFYGGARGGGKTEGSIGDWLLHSYLYGEHAIGIFVRRTLRQLQETIERTKQIFLKLGAKWKEQDKMWIMPGGGRLKFVYLERDSDAENYQGHSYTRVYVEEVTNFPSPGPINKLRATLRSGIGVQVGMRLTGNPGGPGHNWVKARYIDPDPRGWLVITERTQIPDPDDFQKLNTVELERVFIPSKLGDNKLLMRNDPTYVLRLKQTGSEKLVQAWLDGNWDIVDGAYFDCWDENIHVIQTPDFLRWLGSVPNVREMVTMFRSFDWGSAKPFSVGWWAVIPEHVELQSGRLLPAGSLVRYREWYGKKEPNVGLKMDAPAVAKGIVEIEKLERIRYGVADPAIFIRNGGPSIAETMVLNRCAWGMADNKRKPGWEQVRSRLTGEDGYPMLYVCDNCEDLIRTLPALQHDERDPEDLDTDGEDHAADDLRYACMSRPYIAMGAGERKIKSSRPSNDATQMTFNDLLKLNAANRKAKDSRIIC